MNKNKLNIDSGYLALGDNRFYIYCEIEWTYEHKSQFKKKTITYFFLKIQKFFRKVFKISSRTSFRNKKKSDSLLLTYQKRVRAWSPVQSNNK